MKTAIICIGSEINLGLIVNTNAAYIAQKLSEIGIESNLILSVKDLKEDIKNAINFCIMNSDIIIISGGLGPTEDDITREAVAEYFSLKLIKKDFLDKTSLHFIKKEISNVIKERLLKQSYIPEGARAIIPNIGSASGFELFLKEKNKWLFSIPGVPKEMKDMMENSVIRSIKNILKRFQDSDVKLLKKVLLTTGISESEIEEKIPDIYRLANDLNVEIGITASPGIIRLIIVSKSLSEMDNIKNVNIIKNKLTERLGEFIYGEENMLISESLKDAIDKSGVEKLSISAAESMTGGLVSEMITDVPGSSLFFKGSLVSYSNFSKIKLLGIDENLIKVHGAVSEEVCRAMALNSKKLFCSDYSVSITGFAGPDADSAQKLGLTYIGIAGPDKTVKIFKLKFIGTRTEIKYRASQFALNQLRLQILGSG